MSEAWQAFLGCDLPSCTEACSQQILGMCSGTVRCLLAVFLCPMLAWQPCVAGRGRMGAERLAGLFGKTAVRLIKLKNMWFLFAGLCFHQVSELIGLASHLQDVKW